ncbi:hypothetical protein FRC03_002499 [Tulasnella sp. 419]|nr:hypothetical protein FRC03_002499 [Tulasnella sp. 419]
MWEPVALPSEVTGLRGYGVSSPGYPGTYHPGVSMGWSWQSNSTPISPDLRGISGQFSPRPAYAEPAYVEYAAGSHSTNAATTTGAATSQGSTSEGSVIVFDMNTSKVEPIPRPKWRFPEQEVFPLNNGAPVIQMMNHDPKPQPCKGHGFRHWLHTHFRHHGCPSDPLKDVVITLPKKM